MVVVYCRRNREKVREEKNIKQLANAGCSEQVLPGIDSRSRAINFWDNLDCLLFCLSSGSQLGV